MEIRYTTELFPCDRGRINALYGREDAYGLFAGSFAHVLAYDGDFLVGAVRAISEGVETVLVVDLKEAEKPEEYLRSPSDARNGNKPSENVTAGLLRELEKEFAGRRVMLYGSRNQLAALEAAGYGRCKNAWTLFREGMSEKDFLPAGYRFEIEFLSGTPGSLKGGAVPNGPAANARSEAKDSADAGVKVLPNEVAKVLSDAGVKVLSDAERNAIKERITYPGGRNGATDEQINEILTKAFFGRPHDVNKTAKAFAQSSYIATAYDGDRLIGVARAVADGSRYATILNVAVDPQYQGLSVGKKILLELSARITEPTVVLNTHPGAVGFYNKIAEYRRNRYVFEKHIPLDTEPKRPDNPEFRLKMFTPAGYRFPDEYEED